MKGQKPEHFETLREGAMPPVPFMTSFQHRAQFGRGRTLSQAGPAAKPAVSDRLLSETLMLSLSPSFTPSYTHTHTHTHTVMTDSPRVPSSVPPAVMPVIRRPTPRSGAVTVEHDKQLPVLKQQSADLTAV